MPSNNLQIVPLSRTPRDISRFLKGAYDLYRDDPNWVAPILMDLKKVFTDANPFFKHAEMQLWVARKDGRDVGRIAGISDRHHNQVVRQTEALFGFFESIDDPEVASLLFSTCERWAQQKGAKRISGPFNPSSNDECGLLVEGFNSPPVFMMTYNPRFYERLIEVQGYRQAKDLLAYMIDLSSIPMERLLKIASKVKSRNPTMRFRPLLRRTIEADLGKVKEIYNEAWQENWGFIPMTDDEVNFLADRLKPLLMEGLIWIAEEGAEPVGFLLALPDYNIGIKPLKGRLLTPKIFGFLPYVLGWKRPHRTRVVTLGVKEKYRSRGLETAMLIEGLKVGFDAGVTESEASWILEDNTMMRRVLEAIGGRVYKRYRIYEKPM